MPDWICNLCGAIGPASQECGCISIGRFPRVTLENTEGQERVRHRIARRLTHKILERSKLGPVDGEPVSIVHAMAISEMDVSDPLVLSTFQSLGIPAAPWVPLTPKQVDILFASVRPDDPIGRAYEHWRDGRFPDFPPYPRYSIAPDE